MESALLVIALAAIATAIYFWRAARLVQRRESERSEARVAVLSDAAIRPTPHEGWSQVDGELRPARQTILHDADHPSHIVLPIVPR